MGSINQLLNGTQLEDEATLGPLEGFKPELRVAERMVAAEVRTLQARSTPVSVAKPLKATKA